MADWTTNCDACGALLIDGAHPPTECYPKQWAIHNNRLLGEIAFLLRAQAAALKPAAPAPALAGKEPQRVAEQKKESTKES